MSKLSKINIYVADNGYSVGKLGNTILNKNSNELFCFLPRDVQKDDLLKLEDYIVFIFNNYPEVWCVYTDNIMVDDGVEYPMYFPTYYNTVFNDVIINTPFVCRGSIKTRFNENLTYLYYHDFLKQASEKYVLWHIAEFGFKISPPLNPQVAQSEVTQYIK